jgi:VIT1/CCC1 family predicted Fe2+/Mn2+ transporter
MLSSGKHEAVNADERTEAIFGAFDGVVSTIGFVFGLLVHQSPGSAIAIGGLGGAISASISMTTGEYESRDEPARARLPGAAAMGTATLIGSLVPVWPFFVFPRNLALGIAAVGCVLVATWIGREKRRGIHGYAVAYLTLLGAAALTLGIVSLIPQSAG